MGSPQRKFPRENLDDYISRKYLNKRTAYYTDVLNLNRNLNTVGRKTREPSELCKKKREEILNKWPDCFKETLEKGDRIKHPPIKIKLKENSEIPPLTTVAPTIHPFTSGRPTLGSSKTTLMPGSWRSAAWSPVSGPVRPFRW